MVKISKKTKVIKDLKQFIINNKLDGYIVPKNDKYLKSKLLLGSYPNNSKNKNKRETSCNILFK